jgi:hypothetical protein
MTVCYNYDSLRQTTIVYDKFTGPKKDLLFHAVSNFNTFTAPAYKIERLRLLVSPGCAGLGCFTPSSTLPCHVVMDVIKQILAASQLEATYAYLHISSC